VGHFPEKWLGHLAEKSDPKMGHFLENSHPGSASLLWLNEVFPGDKW
jgi:hypothetical protein